MQRLVATTLMPLILLSCLADMILVVCSYADSERGHVALELLSHRTDTTIACDAVGLGDGAVSFADCTDDCHHDACNDSSVNNPAIPSSRMDGLDDHHQAVALLPHHWQIPVEPIKVLDGGSAMRPRAPPEHRGAIAQFCSLRLLI